MLLLHESTTTDRALKVLCLPILASSLVFANGSILPLSSFVGRIRGREKNSTPNVAGGGFSDYPSIYQGLEEEACVGSEPPVRLGGYGSHICRHGHAAAPVGLVLCCPSLQRHLNIGVAIDPAHLVCEPSSCIRKCSQAIAVQLLPEMCTGFSVWMEALEPPFAVTVTPIHRVQLTLDFVLGFCPSVCLAELICHLLDPGVHTRRNNRRLA